MKDIPNSKPIRAINIIKGIRVIIKKIILIENSLYKKVDKIFRRECPATTLANNRVPREKALAI